jgi:acetyl-CoA carboxylase biotin carboxyl carrier protein
MSSEPRDFPSLPDLRYIRELAKVFRQYELDEIEIESGEHRVLLRRSDFPAGHAPVAAPPPAPAAAPRRPLVEEALHAYAPAPAEPAPDNAVYITSPFVGTFYRSASPDQPSFVEAGATVRPGQVLCIVEAMKLFNELEAEFACVIEEVLLDNAKPVEYGAKLFRVRKL